MQEFKSISFVMFDGDGEAHKIKMDVLEGDYPSFKVKGDPNLLLRRWRLVADRIERHLKAQCSEAKRSS
ncbi:hypothetical protein E4H12_06325 [Candidatus Thorarchaeota archaeon]|nr:MAG: hypothetical protein E4H12_06325 [Candidatus Thorarchaeota archaeon]